MTPRNFDAAVDSTLEQISSLASRLRAFAEESGCSKDEEFAIDLAAAEAGSNVVRHGYRGESGHSIRVRLSVETALIVLEFLDDGLPVPIENRVPVPPPEATDDPAMLLERGRGVYLIHQVMDSVTFSTERGSNLLRMVRHRPRRPQ